MRRRVSPRAKPQKRRRVLGRLRAVALVWYRLALVVVVMGGLIAWRRLGLAVPRATLRRLRGAGAFVALHWLLFYGCIKYAGVAVAVLCLSTITFFTALFEPLVFRRAVAPVEVVLGLSVMGGVALLVKVEAGTDALGLGLGLGSALFSACFGALNGRLAREVRGEVMTFHELSSALVVTSAFFAVTPGDFVGPWALSGRNLGLLLALAVGCTVLPWLWSLTVLKTLSPYTLALAVNLEPVYAMVLAYFFFPGEERLTWRFYAGTAVLVALVAANAWLKRPSPPVARMTEGVGQPSTGTRRLDA